MNLKLNKAIIILTVLGISNIALAELSAIDMKREEIVVFSRQGDVQLGQAIKQLAKLYRQTKDQKVRDDLIALMMRKEQFREATQVCTNCKLSSFSENELENLAKAHRNVQLFDKSHRLYVRLNSAYPQNPNGALGAALTAIELSQYHTAERYLAQYKAKFGIDDGYQDAKRYLLSYTESDISKLGRLQDELKQAPTNSELALELYRLAAKLSVHPLQERLIQDYPQLFTQNDLNWLSHSAINSQGKEKDLLNKSELKAQYTRLSQIIETTSTENVLYLQAVQSRLVLANRMENNQAVKQDYTLLQSLAQPIPAHVQEAYADTLLREGSAFKALEIYETLAQESENAGSDINTDIIFKLVGAASDAGYFAKAEAYLNQLDERETVWDFTRTSRIENPNYDRAFYSRASLLSWRGKRTEAISMVEDRLNNQTPGDPWTMLALSDLETDRNNHDQALFLANKAQHFLGDGEHVFMLNQKANIALNQGNLPEVNRILSNYLPEELERSETVLKRYSEARQGSFVASFNMQHQTAPSNKPENERSQEYYLNTPKTWDGHYAYVHFLENKTPLEWTTLRQQRIGAGFNLNLFPLTLDMEAGKGIKLNTKSYFSFNTAYAFNENWKFFVEGNINGSNSPVRAINQGIYTKDSGIGANYTYRDLFRLGSGINVMEFDDNNLRKSFYVWGNVETFKHDRWTLNNNIRFDYQKNKEISTADYYNPENSRNVELGANLSYWQPFNYGMSLTHFLKVNIGQYKQKHHSAERTWSVSYGHDWRLTKKIYLSYEIGRKKNIYDGDAEFNNYGSVNISYSF